MGKNKSHGTIIDLGDAFADIIKDKGKGSGYNITIVDKMGSRPDLAKIDVGNKNMLYELLSLFTGK